MTTKKLTKPIIEAAILGFESQRARLAEQISELRGLLDGRSPEATAVLEAPTPKRRKFSAAARRRMRDAQKARWAKIPGESERPSQATQPEKPKRRISEEGMKRIIAATKKRWRLQKAAKAHPSTRKAAVKKASAKAPAAKAA